VTGVNDASITVDQWIVSGITPTYVSATQFTLAGDQTSAFQVGRRVKATVTAGTVYGTITASAFAVLTTVTLAMDGAQVLDSGLSAVSYGIITPDNTSFPTLTDAAFRISGSADKTKKIAFEADNVTTGTTRTQTAQDKDVTVAGLADINQLFPFNAVTTTNTLVGTLSATTGLPFALGFRNATAATGTPNTYTFTANSTLTIPTTSSLGLTTAVGGRIAWLEAYNAGSPVMCVVNVSAGALPDENALISPTTIGAASTSATTIYSASAVAANSPFRVIGYTDTVWTSGTGFTSLTVTQPMGGQIQVKSTSQVRLNTANGKGSTNTVIDRFTNVVENVGTDITYADSVTLGATFTINTPGVYAITHVGSAVNQYTGISLNSTQLTTSIGSITISDVIAIAGNTASGQPVTATTTLRLKAGDVIRPHSTTTADNQPALSLFTITKVNL
jgi:hypothetical protein